MIIFILNTLERLLKKFDYFYTEPLTISSSRLQNDLVEKVPRNAIDIEDIPYVFLKKLVKKALKIQTL